MNIAALLPHLGVYGGVRRYLEMGNVFVSLGHHFSLFVKEFQKLTWFNFKGNIQPFDKLKESTLDVLFCGDVGLLNETKSVNASLKIIQLIGCRGTEKYKKLYDEVKGRSDFLFVGVSQGWEKLIGCENGLTIPGGVNTKFFRPLNLEKNSQDFCILTLGRIDKKVKCVENVIKALKLLKRNDFKLILYNDKPIKLGLRGWGVKIEKRIGLTQEDLVKLYNEADIYISAESGAGWSNPCAEAMACKKPVICTRHGTSDFAINNITAIVLQNGTPREIANAIELLYTNKNLREQISEAGYKKIQDFSWENVSSKLLELIEHKISSFEK